MRLSLPALLAAALYLPAAAAAERDTERADSEFQAAHRLFNDGDYEAAQRRYEAAYRLAPHPNILYNLALTYERQLSYDDAIATFERFLAEPASHDPTERSLKLLAERALRRLRSLPAQISVSAVPEQVEVSVRPVLTGGALGPPRWQGRTPAVFKVPAGRYRLRYWRSDCVDEEVTIDAHVGQALLVQRQLRFRARALSVVASPPARLYLDDRLLGETPFSGTVEVGAHRLRLERRFYLPYVDQFTVAPARTPVRYRVPLEQNGRLELLAAATLAGAGIGLVALRTINRESFDRTSPQDAYKPLFAALLPAALGAGIVLLGVDKIPASSVQMIVGNATWGTLMGLGLGFGIDPTGDRYLPHWLAVGTGVLGATMGLGLDRRLHPRSGAVALYNSAATWGATLGALTWAYLITHGLSGSFVGDISGASGGGGGWALLGGTAAGVSIGAVLASLRPLSHLSRQHVALIDLGGVIGGLSAGALGLGISYGVTQSWQGAGRVGVLSAAGGIAAGLVSAALLTRRYRADRPAQPPRPAALRLDTPSLALGPQPGGFGAELTLLRGLW